MTRKILPMGLNVQTLLKIVITGRLLQLVKPLQEKHISGNHINFLLFLKKLRNIFAISIWPASNFLAN